MFGRLLISASILASSMLAQALAQAGEAGHIIYAAGDTKMADQAVALGAAVQEGALLSTGDKSYIYVKTIDDGLFILRPNTKARIVTYHVDAANPANTRIKLELISGVARSRSGEAVKLARQNFRFNTPVAAIGVRGTDFSVSTDHDTTRVSVISGGVTVSGFGGACRPEGSGPCEGVATRELSALQRGQLLQIQRDQAAPQLMQGGALMPDTVAPPRPDEPVAKTSAPGTSAAPGGSEPTLDPKKTASLQQQVAALTPPPPKPVDPTPVVPDPTPTPTPPAPTPTPDPTPAPVVTPPVTPVTPPVTQPDPTPTPPVEPPDTTKVVSWGRYAAIANMPAAPIDFAKASEGQKLVALNPLFAIFRSNTGTDYTPPERGSASFTLKQSEAYVIEDVTQRKTAATLENGLFAVDFGKASFTTSFDLLNQSNRYQLYAQGSLGPDGHLYGDGQLKAPSTMDVDGTLTKNGAVYLFQGRLGTDRSVLGVASWGK